MTIASVAVLVSCLILTGAATLFSMNIGQAMELIEGNNSITVYLKEDMPTFMDATDGLAAAYCHFLQMGRPALEKGYNSWKDYIAKNPDKVK